MDLASGRMEGIATLLERYKKITVPIYQRNYSWDTDQVKELLDDLFGSLQSERPHFLGCLILQDDPKDKSKCEVVDGQQRLTTVFLVLARIQDELHRLSKAGFNTIDGQGDELERNPKIEVQSLIFNQNLARPRFLSNSLVSDMFKDRMLNPKRQEEPPERDAKQKAITLPLRKAYWEVRDRIQSWLRPDMTSETDQLRFLARLLDAAKRLQVLCITTSLQEESLEVFLTLNNRGLPLGPSDIIRGQLIQALTEGLTSEQVGEVHNKVVREWQSIMKSFDEAGEQQNSIDQFFRYYLLATGTAKVGARHAPREMEKRIRQKQVEDKSVERSLEERRFEAARIWANIQTYARTWITILQPPSDLSDECTYQLQILRHISDNYRVLLLNVFNPANAVSDPDKTEISRLCVVLTLRWYLNGQGAQDLESTFQSLGSSFTQAKDTEKLIIELRSKAKISPPLEARFREGENRNAKAILHGIERSLARKVGANPMPWSTTDLHVEHVAPDTQTDNWINLLFPKGDEDNKYDETVSQLGNLTVLDRKLNIRVQQSLFTLKKEKYAVSTSMMTRDLCEIVDWSTDEIKKRQEWLVDMFNVIWSEYSPNLEAVHSYSTWKSLPKEAS